MQIRFYNKAVQDKAATKEKGRPIYRDVEMIEIDTGDRRTQLHYPAHESTMTYDAESRTDDDRTWVERYPDAYAAFVAENKATPTGTPLDQWPLLTTAKVSELKAVGLMTVEEVADMPKATQTLMKKEGTELKAQAKAYLEKAEGGAPLAKMTAENEDMKEQIAAMQKLLDERKKEDEK